MELTYQIEDIERIAQKVLEALTTKTIMLNGSMGVGKTTFAKSLVRLLGSKDDVSSPTFSIVNEYELVNDVVYHFDMYRVNDENEALQFGIDEYLSSHHWILMEWSENIPNLLPEDYDIIDITLNDNKSRTLKLTKNINLTNKDGKNLQKLNN